MDIRSFNEWIEEVRSYGIKPGLGRVKELLRRLENPQNKLDIIHITGTNGKGSTATLLRHILCEGGYKTGQFSTPSIIDFNHMFLIDDQPITDRRLCEIASNLKDEIDSMLEDGYNHPTEYEIIAAIMYVYYYEEHVDFAVVEVAMGGENDCTNVMDYSILSVITPISMDHQNFLGSTLQAIATEKSGVIKNNSVVISHPQKTEVMNVIKKVSDEKFAVLISFDEIKDVTIDNEMTFNYEGLDIKSKLLGVHQATNIVGVIEGIHSLNKRGFTSISKDQLLDGIKSTVFEGRFERKNGWILDGAHNYESLIALKNTLELLNIKNVVGVIGVLKDKDIDEALKDLKPFISKLIVTEPESFRKLSAEDLYKKLESLGYESLIMEPNIRKAYDLAMKSENVRLGFGSFYMLSELRKYV